MSIGSHLWANSLFARRSACGRCVRTDGHRCRTLSATSYPKVVRRPSSNFRALNCPLHHQRRRLPLPPRALRRQLKARAAAHPLRARAPGIRRSGQGTRPPPRGVDPHQRVPALEWMIDQYQVKGESDPNREDDPHTTSFSWWDKQSAQASKPCASSRAPQPLLTSVNSRLYLRSFAPNIGHPPENFRPRQPPHSSH